MGRGARGGGANAPGASPGSLHPLSLGADFSEYLTSDLGSRGSHPSLRFQDWEAASTFWKNKAPEESKPETAQLPEVGGPHAAVRGASGVGAQPPGSSPSAFSSRSHPGGAGNLVVSSILSSEFPANIYSRNNV